MSPTPKPHLVLISGAWHTPAHYALLVSKLEARGYTVHTRQMPSIGNPDPPTDLSQDIDATDALVNDAIADGNDVVVLAHSWGGFVIGSALRGLSKTDRTAQGKKGGVVRCGYIAAFMVDEGFRWKEEELLPNYCVVEAPYVHVTSPAPFYQDLPEADQQHWFAETRSHALGSFTSPARSPSWKRIPSAYLVCVDDAAIPEKAQDGMLQGARDLGASIEVTRVNSGHSPFLSCPDVVVEWVEGLAG
ncbi:alpha/beta-hydrolase [Dothidotthia symphoricarpi CBS 119687]|uniref:Alpha/beta-hydrolase n=1 Tax=Dothidotthia symphoricarpi CBS 119687 TaxID=1392245 RepID=A0A6A6AB16_9PLEO|nr:alpha/beta-hydrolase [Dothidotthia symphoricarpi CBS 119687]KAF2129020.1 alpha/beta-hydrolase [Dothidotthia symphoricarpi CBS 119687]